MPSESAGAGMPVAHRAGASCAQAPHRRVERRHRGQRGHRLVERRRAVASTASRRGWRPPSRRDRHRSRPRACCAQRVAEPGRVGVRRLAALAARGRPSRRPGAGSATHSASASSIAWSCSDRASTSSWSGASLRPGVGAGVEGVGGSRGRRRARRRCRAASGRRRRGSRRRRAAPARRRPRPGSASPGANVQPRKVAPPTRRTQQAGAALGQVEPAHPPARASSSAPAASRRSRSASDSTWTTRPRVRFTRHAERRLDGSGGDGSAR